MKAGRPTYHVKAKWILVFNQDGTSSYFELDSRGNLVKSEIPQKKKHEIKKPIVSKASSITHTISMPQIATFQIGAAKPLDTSQSTIIPEQEINLLFEENETNSEIEIDIIDDDILFSNSFSYQFDETFF